MTDEADTVAAALRDLREMLAEHPELRVEWGERLLIRHSPAVVEQLLGYQP